jgi:hypothetical protein
MTQPELRIAVDWAADEGWNPGLNDAACFYAADPPRHPQAKRRGA